MAIKLTFDRDLKNVLTRYFRAWDRSRCVVRHHVRIDDARLSFLNNHDNNNNYVNLNKYKIKIMIIMMMIIIRTTIIIVVVMMIMIITRIIA